MKKPTTEESEAHGKLRLDKWLWAARFFKTRSLAKAAVEGGKVQVAGQRVKVAKEISVGEQIQLRQGFDERIVVVQALSNQRRGAPEAQLLYQETVESLARESPHQKTAAPNSQV
jgi:ribosome-associated heat shock protein Hsp15